MSRRFINELGEHEVVDQIFLASEKQLRTNRNGNLYLQVRLSDRSGTMMAMMWNANDQVYHNFDNGDYVNVEGTTQYHNGAIQVIAKHLRRAETAQVDEEDFVSFSAREIDRLTVRLGEILRQGTNTHLRNLAECFLIDETFMDKFTRAPAGIKNHHAYRGGLLEHVVGLMEVVQVVAPRYPELDVELLTMGAFLHDMGKIDELIYKRDFGYSDEGQLIGHVVMAVGMFEEKVREAERLSGEEFPPSLVLRIKHMIVSHHGQYEFGSPKLPMTLEAVALHQLDNLDAKIHSFSQLMRDDANVDSNWTSYHPNIGRKLYKTNR